MKTVSCCNEYTNLISHFRRMVDTVHEAIKTAAEMRAEAERLAKAEVEKELAILKQQKEKVAIIQANVEKIAEKS